jgi:hypothetical protein
MVYRLDITIDFPKPSGRRKLRKMQNESRIQRSFRLLALIAVDLRAAAATSSMGKRFVLAGKDARVKRQPGYEALGLGRAK